MFVGRSTENRGLPWKTIKKKVLTTTFPEMLESVHSMTIFPCAENDPSDDLGQALHNVQADCESETERLKFQKLLEDHHKLLYPDCQNGLKKLRTTLELLQWKATNDVFDKGFGELLKLVKKMFPKDNELPTTTYEAKQLIYPLGLEVQKIHACPQ